MMKKTIILILVIFLFSLSFVNAVETNSTSYFENIGKGLFYNVRSSIFKWWHKTKESIKSVFVDNVETYESEREKNRAYLIKRNENLKKSLEGNDEPPFDYGLCPQSTPVTADTKFDFCSCGDGVCASYEDKCKCPKDCGSCPEGNVCKRGKCVEFIPNTCMNTICEEGENETCPWDCKLDILEEEEEILTEEEKRQVAERIRNEFEWYDRTIEEIMEGFDKEQDITEEEVEEED
jgi:hypothetical protein